MNIKSLLTLVLFAFWLSITSAQNDPQKNNGGTFTGSLDAYGNFFQRDTTIDAANTPQYDRQLFSADTWLNLQYSNWGFDFGMRFDLANNSNLLNPTGSFTAQGIGRWFIHKKVNKLDITVGYIYDQIGSGIIYRTYEERALAIDNALFGARLMYDITPDWRVKVFTGKQKKQLSTYDAIIKGGSFEGFYALKNGNISFAPGIGVTSRTLDDATMETITSEISSYTPQDSIGAQYNTYAFTAFNTMTAGDFSWYVEGAYKTKDVFFNPLAEKLNWTGETSLGKLENKTGSVIYSSLSYAHKGLGVTLEAKRTENFRYRTDPFVQLAQGAINFLPPMSRQNTYRLTARYTPATQEIGEQAVQADVRYKFNKHWSALVNFSNITNLNNLQLYRELFTEVTYKKGTKWQLLGGLQFQNYNQEIYLNKPKKPIINTVIPYAEFLYKFSPKKSIRVEAQYLQTEQEFGSWAFGLVEFSVAPHWIFIVSDMYNVPTTDEYSKVGDKDKLDSKHFPTLGVVYINKTNRFSLNYVKQVQGIVCSGGICRVEPAFSGVKLTVNSIF
ncbi:MAG: hypothetical protein KA974_07140 [Saprospiraceae bacterium]|nr:hypothetical protein [Saprospiraceae bacterium]MBP7699378.1 hypothetical protein [Saprospiraceae bacterium]